MYASGFLLGFVSGVIAFLGGYFTARFLYRRNVKRAYQYLRQSPRSASDYRIALLISEGIATHHAKSAR